MNPDDMEVVDDSNNCPPQPHPDLLLLAEEENEVLPPLPPIGLKLPQNPNNYIHRLPHEVLTTCIRVFLTQREAYRLFASCQTWYPLLQDIRCFTFQIHSWRTFIKDEAYRGKVLKMLGYVEGKKPLRRKLKLSLAVTDLQHIPTLITYLDYFQPFPSYILFEKVMQKAIVDHPEMDEAANKAHFDCLLPFPHWHSLTQLVVTDKNIVKNPDIVFNIGNTTCAMPLRTSLKSIRSISMDADNRCRLDLAHNESLQRVDIFGGDHQLHDLSPLVGVHSVWITLCSTAIDIQSLSACQYVKLSSLSMLTDVSSLAMLAYVELINISQLTDISMLGGVNKLYITKCMKIIHFPKPTKTHQSWSFRSVNISDLTGMEKLLELHLCSCNKLTDVSNLVNIPKLEIDHCPGITDISMLGNVKNLVVTDAKGFIRKYPTPVRTDQHWHFQDIDFSLLLLRSAHVGEQGCTTIATLDLTHFDCLSELYLYNCKYKSQVAIVCNAHTLTLRECHDIVDVTGLQHVKLLNIEMCHLLGASNPSLALLQHVEELRVHHFVVITKEN